MSTPPSSGRYATHLGGGDADDATAVGFSAIIGKAAKEREGKSDSQRSRLSMAVEEARKQRRGHDATAGGSERGRLQLHHANKADAASVASSLSGSILSEVKEPVVTSAPKGGRKRGHSVFGRSRRGRRQAPQRSRNYNETAKNVTRRRGKSVEFNLDHQERRYRRGDFQPTDDPNPTEDLNCSVLSFSSRDGIMPLPPCLKVSKIVEPKKATQVASTKKHSKSKKKTLWKAMKGFGKKKEQKETERRTPPPSNSQTENPSPADTSLLSSNTSCSTAMSASFPHSLPDFNPNSSLFGIIHEDNNNYDVAPWEAHTMDMLVKTGQLDYEEEVLDINDTQTSPTAEITEEGSVLSGTLSSISNSKKKAIEKWHFRSSRRGRSQGRSRTLSPIRNTSAEGRSRTLSPVQKIKNKPSKKGKEKKTSSFNMSSNSLSSKVSATSSRKRSRSLFRAPSAESSTTPDKKEKMNAPKEKVGRSRSLFRAPQMSTLHENGTTKQEEDASKPGRRGLSIELPGRPIRRELSLEPPSKSHPTKSQGYPNEIKPTYKKCLVCHTKVPKEEAVRHMGFYFCPAEGSFCPASGTCFQCGFCHRSLVGEENDDGIQIISNAKGRIVQCGKCASSITGMTLTFGADADDIKYNTSSLNNVMSSTLNNSSSLNNMSSLNGSAFNSSASCNLVAPKAQRRSNSVERSSNSAFSTPVRPSAIRPSPRASSLPPVSRYNVDQQKELARLVDQQIQCAAKRPVQKVDEAQIEYAAMHLLGKASVTLSLAARSGRKRENEILSKLSFMKREDDDGSITTVKTESGATVSYELDADAYGNPNHDCYRSSLIDIEEVGEAAITSVALPELESDDNDGTVSKELEIDFQWLDDDGCSYASVDSRVVYPTRSGPAVLSIEAFQSNAVNKDTVRKVLRQKWECKDNGVLYEFTFVVPFQKRYMSWVIDEGDELDLAHSHLEVTIKYDTSQELFMPLTTKVPETTMPPEKLASDAASLELSGLEDNSEDEIDVDPMPNEIYVKTDADASFLSVSGGGSTSTPPSFIKDPDRDENDNFSELLSMATCTDSIIALPSITYVKAERNDPDCEIGLSLIEKNGAAVVAEVSKSGLFVQSDIKEGCEILAINGQCVRGPRSVMRMLKDITGDILIMVSEPAPPGSRFVVKNHRSAGLFGGTSGSDITQDIEFEYINGLVRVKDVDASGIFSDSSVSKGDICLSIDGIPVTSDVVAARTLGRSQSIVAMLIFSLPDFWKRIVEFIFDEKYHRWWKKESVVTLLFEECAPITLTLDEKLGICIADGNDKNEIDLQKMNIILGRVMKLLTKSINAYRMAPKGHIQDSSKGRSLSQGRSLSVSASGKMQNRSDVYRRALIKLDEMRAKGMLSAKDYEAGRQALAQVALESGFSEQDFSPPASSFDSFEEMKHRTDAITKAAIVLQARARTFLCQNKFYLMQGSVLTLQCAARKVIASYCVRRLRLLERVRGLNESATTIQKQWRSHYARFIYLNNLYIATLCQRFWRGGMDRKRCVQIKQCNSATVIQSAWRTHISRKCNKLAAELSKKDRELERLRQHAEEISRKGKDSLISSNILT